MASLQRLIDLLMNRPSEPIFMPKGDGLESFEGSDTFLTDEYKGIGTGLLANRFGESDKITLQEPKTKPDLTFADALGRRDNFSTWVPLHQEIAAQLISIMMDLPVNDPNEFISVIAYIRDRVNTKLYSYALSVVLLHRPDTKDINLPNFMESFPSNFVDGQVFQEARENAALVPIDQRGQVPITIPRDFTASDLEPEHKMAYFREDIGVNLHHWHWHLVYPFNAGAGNIDIVRKDRRGELFYYMHQQLMARYNADRLCNDMARAKKFGTWTDAIAEAYYPKLDNLTASRAWPPRQSNMKWQDLNREVDGVKLAVQTLNQWRTRIDDAIKSRAAKTPNGTTVPLTIDLLGDIVEASVISVYPGYYGNLHNSGHLLMAYVHDPDNRYLESFGVMGDSATAMRDPFFYRWHAFINDLFQSFKIGLNPYLDSELEYQGVSITNLNVQRTAGGGQANRIDTFWMQSIVNLSRGLDFADRGAVYTKFTHLNHQPFTYIVNYRNTGPQRFATCRIFLAPKIDEARRPWQFEDQRHLFIEMDRFVVQLQQGNGVINRNSADSSVTIPFERVFRNLSGPGTSPQQFANAQQATFNFCGCGWPQHMLVPKGSQAGVVFQLFCMLSNYNLDNVNQNTDGVPCQDASSFCGIKDRLYPDRRPMGFPFDRPSSTASAIDQFITNKTNMGVRDVTILHSDVVIQNPNNPQ